METDGPLTMVNTEYRVVKSLFFTRETVILHIDYTSIKIKMFFTLKQSQTYRKDANTRNNLFLWTI